MTTLVLFRDDLRVADQPALAAAAATGDPVVCLFLFDEETPGLRPLGGASRWWLHGSLAALGGSLKALGNELIVARGPQVEAIPAIANAVGAKSVHWNIRFGGGERRADDALAAALHERSVAVSAHNGNLLSAPDAVLTRTGGGFKVFTPFWRALQTMMPLDPPSPAPAKLRRARWPREAPFRCTLEDLALLPTQPDWAGGLRETWKPGEAGAQERLAFFLEHTIDGYAEARNLPDVRGSSQLSPHLRHGELSSRQVWSFAEEVRRTGDRGSERDWETFFKELAWREFSYHLLSRSPEIATRNLKPGFEGFPHRSDPTEIRAWRLGQTGYPIVDAGMRQLWRTGWMHNRIRMVAASFLIKHLLMDWRRGEEWFWDTLVDADPANNAASWQWVAGTGADAAPYFRVFNPVLQGQTWDPGGGYVRRFVPELAHLPDRYIHAPWTAPPAVLRNAGVSLGRDYPKPVVVHEEARQRALAAYRSLRRAAS